MSAKPSSSGPRQPWLAVRRDLSPARRVVLMVLSFLLPLGIWSAATYIPAFQGFVKFTITAPKIANMAAYTPGTRVSKDYFPQYLDMVRQVNEGVVAKQQAGEIERSTRRNKQRIRQLQHVAEANGWLEGVDLEDTKAVDQALMLTIGRLADGSLAQGKIKLIDENVAIIQANWQVIQAAQPEEALLGELLAGDIAQSTAQQAVAFPKTPLQYMIPQGFSASPTYLPAPHECVMAAWRDFTTEPSNNMPWMYERLGGSLKVVFGAFLLACAIGVPLGLLCGTYDIFAKLLEPFVDFFRYMPAPTFGLLLQAAFGIYGAPKIALVFIGTFPHMLLMLGNTTRLLDKSLLEAAQTLGAKNKALVVRVIIPGILPKMYNDLRVLLGWAWTWLVIAELIGEKSGLTDFIVTQGGKYNFDRVFPVIMMIGVIGFATDQLLQSLSRVLFPWENPSGKKGLVASLIGFVLSSLRSSKPQTQG